MTKQRETGYYWVKWKDDWIIGHYGHSAWYIISEDRPLDDRHFSRIDERRIEREAFDANKSNLLSIKITK